MAEPKAGIHGSANGRLSGGDGADPRIQPPQASGRAAISFLHDAISRRWAPFSATLRGRFAVSSRTLPTHHLLAFPKDAWDRRCGPHLHRRRRGRFAFRTCSNSPPINRRAGREGTTRRHSNTPSVLPKENYETSPAAEPATDSSGADPTAIPRSRPSVGQASESCFRFHCCRTPVSRSCCARPERGARSSPALHACAGASMRGPSTPHVYPPRPIRNARGNHSSPPAPGRRVRNRRTPGSIRRSA
jgi:hypothetical protein